MFHTESKVLTDGLRVNEAWSLKMLMHNLFRMWMLCDGDGGGNDDSGVGIGIISFWTLHLIYFAQLYGIMNCLFISSSDSYFPLWHHTITNNYTNYFIRMRWIINFSHPHTHSHFMIFKNVGRFLPVWWFAKWIHRHGRLWSSKQWWRRQRRRIICISILWLTN